MNIKKRHLCNRLLVLVTISLLGYVSEAQEESLKLPGEVTEQHVMVPMRDGTRLSVYLYLPKGDGPWPVLLEQRYANARSNGSRIGLASIAQHGYVVALQNFRGTQLSEGRYVGYRALGWGKQQDGYDTVEWLAKQPFSTGKIGTFGSSQAGFAQNFLAVTQPPSLKCQYMIDTGLSLFHEGYRIGGTTRPNRFKGMAAACRVKSHNDDMLKEWFEHPTYDRYWKDEDCTRHFRKMNVPCMTIGSWYDFMCQGSIESYIGRQHSGGIQSKGNQKLLIGPWLHGRFNKGSLVAEMQYPDNAAIDMVQHMVQWFDHYLKGIDNGADTQPTIQYYAMGAVGEEHAPGNIWKTADDWPVRANDTPYFLYSDQRLGVARPKAVADSVLLKADPFQPAKLPNTAFQGARDARYYEEQPNVLTFTTDPLSSPVEVTGHVTANLHISSDAPDTDLVVRVSDVYPDGRSILIIGYVHRVRYRDGFHKEVFMKPGRIYETKFHVGWMSQVFNEGHRIRVTVSSTGDPFYESNPNTGKPLTIDWPDDARIANNRIHTTRTHASNIVLPVISE